MPPRRGCLVVIICYPASFPRRSLYNIILYPCYPPIIIYIRCCCFYYYDNYSYYYYYFYFFNYYYIYFFRRPIAIRVLYHVPGAFSFRQNRWRRKLENIRRGETCLRVRTVGAINPFYHRHHHGLDRTSFLITS